MTNEKKKIKMGAQFQFSCQENVDAAKDKNAAQLFSFTISHMLIPRPTIDTALFFNSFPVVHFFQSNSECFECERARIMFVMSYSFAHYARARRAPPRVYACARLPNNQ